MICSIRSRMTFANVTSVLALFVALGGGSYAALNLPRGSVGAKQLRKNAVTSPKVKPGSLLLSDFRASQRSRLRGLRGPRGVQGVQGAPGATGAPGPSAASALLGNTITNLSTIENQKLAPSGPTTPIGATMAGNEQRSPNAAIVARDLSVNVATAPGGAAARTFTLVDDDTPTGVSCTIAGAQTACDSGNATATISPGSSLSLSASLTLTPPAGTAANWGWRATGP